MANEQVTLLQYLRMRHLLFRPSVRRHCAQFLHGVALPYGQHHTGRIVGKGTESMLSDLDVILRLRAQGDQEPGISWHFQVVGDRSRFFPEQRSVWS
jgi:hypothetical protein